MYSSAFQDNKTSFSSCVLGQCPVLHLESHVFGINSTFSGFYLMFELKDDEDFCSFLNRITLRVLFWVIIKKRKIRQ